MLKRFLSTGIVVFVGAVMFSVGAPQARASVLENAILQLSDPRTAQTGVTHTFKFLVQATEVGSMTFQYCILPSGGCSNTGTVYGDLGTVLDGAGAPSETFSDEAWGTQSDYTASLNVTYDAEDTSAGTQWTVPFTGMTNPSLANCSHATPSNNSTGTCYVRISVYSATDYSGTPDTAIVSLTVTRAVSVSARVDPVFTFTVTGIAGSSATRNGTALSAVTTTVTTIPFGNLTAGTEKFAAQQLTVTTNTVGGFTIAAYLTANLSGTAYGDDIDPFIGDSANQSIPQSWTVPTGTVSSANTGWLGVGTDDTGVSGQANNAFYSLNMNSDFLVASCPNSASARVTNVVYGIEVNSYQQADNYTGTLLYDALPVY